MLLHMNLEAVKSFAEVVTLENGYEVLEIKTKAATAKIAFQGATLFEWTPAGQSPVIFTSSKAIFKDDKAIRGGVPICWPWFGPHPTDADKPQHGFVRNTKWSLKAVEKFGKEVKVMFQLPFDTHEHIEGAFALSVIFTIGAELTVELVSKNIGDVPLEVGGALHTYFTVGDITKTRVQGLDQVDYLDKPDGGAQKTQTGDIIVGEEVDRVYLDTTADCTVVDEAQSRQITVSKENSATTVVWNPWKEKAQALADMGDDEYQNFVCVETVNTGEDTVTLKPGATHSLIQSIRVS